LAYCLRCMRREDIEQVSEIDRVCFPTMLPYTSYQTELINPMAHYLVLFDDTPIIRVSEITLPPLLPGFAGIWMMAGEAHIINIAVREEYRREGLGELLLIGLIEKARELNASMVTLEVRASNIKAQTLYAKYGFTERGRRRAYYTDNREDAVIMTLDNPNSPDYNKLLSNLENNYEAKWSRRVKFAGS
jgi:[ribosomal protein S18]-alanine N-acetyltransferase